MTWRYLGWDRSVRRRSVDWDRSVRRRSVDWDRSVRMYLTWTWTSL